MPAGRLEDKGSVSVNRTFKRIALGELPLTHWFFCSYSGMFRENRWRIRT